MNLFQQALKNENLGRPPVWFMRQAGRYHSHYQELKKKHSFVELCKNPDLACETTLGPIRDFDFDAAILFSDLLFPLEAMGMDLEYSPGPKLGSKIESIEDLKRLRGGDGLIDKLSFQGEALRKIRSALPESKGLLGFVGAPLTLFVYAVEGTHKGEIASARAGLTDGRFEGFFELLVDLLVENMVLQAKSGADTVCMMDTCAGDFSPRVYQEKIVPFLRIVLEKYQARAPDVPILYYSKNTGPEHWVALKNLPIHGLGIDWNTDLVDVLSARGKSVVQGNIDPHWLFLEPAELEKNLRAVFERVKALPPAALKGWICGLGHGVMPGTPEANVRLFLKIQREMFL